MAAASQEYSVDREIAEFFEKTSATQADCDASAKALVGGHVAPVDVQGVCSYTVYAGPSQEFVVQFRLKSLCLKLDIALLAQEIHGALAPQVSFKGQIGQETDNGKEPLYIYVMSRVQGISHLDFILSHNVPENSPEWFTWRNTLVADFARFFAVSWKHPQTVSSVYLDGLRNKYDKELRLLLNSLPERFKPIIKSSLDTLPAIFSLPTVVLHRDFGSCNVMVDSSSCHLVGVIDWAEAELAPFGLNLHSVQPFVSKFHLKNGWIRYDDYDDMKETFWNLFRTEAGGLSDDTIQTIQSARIVGLLLSKGFTSRLANMPEPVPIQDNAAGAYNLLILDGLLIHPSTKIVD